MHRLLGGGGAVVIYPSHYQAKPFSKTFSNLLILYTLFFKIRTFFLRT